MPKLSAEASKFVKELREQELEMCKSSFWYFVQKAWPYVNSNPNMIRTWHMRVVCEHLEALFLGKIKRLLINVPPGTSKSRIVSILFPAWVWLHDPSKQVLVASHGERIVTDFGEWLLRLLRSDFYKRLNPAVKVPANAAKTNILNGCGGMWFGTTPHGQITGLHGDILIFDDLIEPDNADKKENEFVCQWIPETWESRVNNREQAKFVGVMQRLRENDPAQYCIDHGWTHLNLPARYEGGEPLRQLPNGEILVVDERTSLGENLCPALLPEEDLQRYETQSPYVYAAQYQQRPSPAGGAIFLKDWLQKRWVKLPTGGTWAISVDAAFKGDEDSDFVVIQVWVQSGPDFYLIDQVRDRLSFTETCAAIERMVTQYPKARAKLIEDKANGSAIVDLLGKKMSGVIPVNPAGGKEARANAVSPFFAAGNVWLPPDPPWLEKYTHEMAIFPNGRNDDQVDATTQALTWLAEKHRTMMRADKDVSRAMLGLYDASSTAQAQDMNYQIWRRRKGL